MLVGYLSYKGNRVFLSRDPASSRGSCTEHASVLAIPRGNFSTRSGSSLPSPIRVGLSRAEHVDERPVDPQRWVWDDGDRG